MYKIPVKEDWLAIQPELIYIQKGSEFSIEQVKIDANLEYVEFPVLGVVNFLGGIINVHAGPQFSWLSRVRYIFTDGNSPQNKLEDDDKSKYNQF